MHFPDSRRSRVDTQAAWPHGRIGNVKLPFPAAAHLTENEAKSVIIRLIDGLAEYGDRCGKTSYDLCRHIVLDGRVGCTRRIAVRMKCPMGSIEITPYEDRTP